MAAVFHEETPGRLPPSAARFAIIGTSSAATIGSGVVAAAV
jgi:hypothetical protein